MAKKKAFGIPKNLSDGIGQTINTANSNIGQLRYEIIALDKIHFDPNNPRKLKITKEELLTNIKKNDPDFAIKQQELESLTTLAHSIKKVGVRHPIEIYKANEGYMLISGERRVLSSYLAGKAEIQARILDDKPQELQLRLLQWIENIEREDLTIWEKLGNIKQLAHAYAEANHAPLTGEQLANLLGCSRKQAGRYLAVLNLPQDLQQRLEATDIADLIKLAQIATTEDTELREALISAAVQGASRSALSQIKQLRKESQKPQRKGAKNKSRAAMTLKVTVANKQLVKRMIDCVLQHQDYVKFKERFVHVNWDNSNSTKSALNTLFELMAKQEA